MERLSDDLVRRSAQRKNRGKRGDQWAKLLTVTGGHCFYCGEHLTSETRSRDHVHPRSRGGKGKRYNLVPACKPCNVRKSNRSLDDYRRATVGNEWFYGERIEIERMVDIGAIDREVALEMLHSGPLDERGKE